MQPQIRTVFTAPIDKAPRRRRVVQMPKKNSPVGDISSSSLSAADLKNIKQKASNELLLDEVKEHEKQKEKIKDLVQNSQTPLFKCSTVFPFDLFPDEISIEPTQVNVSKRSFFFTARSKSIPIKNVADAITDTSPFFATLTIIDQNFAENSVSVSYLFKKDAEIARKIIQGLIVMSKEGIDLAKVDMQILRQQVTNIGSMSSIKPI